MGSASEFQRIRISHAAIEQRWCSLVCRPFDTFDKDVRGVFAVQDPRPLLRAGSARRTAPERAGAVADINSRGCQPLLNARDCRSKLTAPAGELPLASSSAGMRNARLCGRRLSAAPSRPERRSWTFIARAAGQSGKQFECASLVRVEWTTLHAKDSSDRCPKRPRVDARCAADCRDGGRIIERCIVTLYKKAGLPTHLPS